MAEHDDTDTNDDNDDSDNARAKQKKNLLVRTEEYADAAPTADADFAEKLHKIDTVERRDDGKLIVYVRLYEFTWVYIRIMRGVVARVVARRWSILILHTRPFRR